MKKWIAMLLAVMTAVSLTACATKSGGQETASDIPDALTILNTVWASYSEDEKFPAAGGDYSEENMTDGKPGKVSLEKPSEIEYLLTLPASVIEEADDAASLFHMMNGNTFTCGVLHLKDAGQLDAAAGEVKTYVMNTQWMCGFPDKLVVASLDGYLISVFGAEDMVDTYEIYRAVIGNAGGGVRSFEEAKKTLRAKNYSRVYAGMYAKGNSLEHLVEKHSRYDPSSYLVRPVSVGSVVVLTRGGKKTAYYADVDGFHEAPDFLMQPQKVRNRRKDRGESR